MWVQQAGKGTSSDGEATGDAQPKLLRRRNELGGEKVGLARLAIPCMPCSEEGSVALSIVHKVASSSACTCH